MGANAHSQHDRLHGAAVIPPLRIAQHVVAERNHLAVAGMALGGIDFIAQHRSEYVCSARLHPGAVSTIRRCRVTSIVARDA
ncbi:hypothetical protein XEUV684_19500 [Xanthomonas euvesicatoria]|nr:hypothetical protein XEUV684_19500 [Xanthomonas euvesicatoria]KLA57351.1 hypothetical protein XEUV685_09580 [Xanthomonas euvesicatoria]KLA66347.1 hypothetical protein XEUV689_14520 [Xanthomonas euvesicatoria]KLA70702.1 hypothetical protein XEUV695_01925 [Xanthomonas euvesicatoria]KLA78851.1 hypothetical protein XEUVH32_14460 [Xanthomonas euvesicatoria]